MPQFKQLREADTTVLALWKAFKYSSIKATVFNDAQEAEGLEKSLEPDNVLFLLLLVMYCSQLIDFKCSYKQETLCLTMLMLS